MSKYVHAQKLNRRVTIERRSGARDEANQPLPDAWVPVCKIWGDWNTISGSAFVDREFIASDREVSRATASLRVRWRTDVKADMRATVDGVPYEIRVVLPDMQDRRFIDIGVAVGANNG